MRTRMLSSQPVGGKKIGVGGTEAVNEIRVVVRATVGRTHEPCERDARRADEDALDSSPPLHAELILPDEVSLDSRSTARLMGFSVLPGVVFTQVVGCAQRPSSSVG